MTEFGAPHQSPPMGLRQMQSGGLNKEDIDRYGFTRIANFKTGSGREAKDPDYIRARLRRAAGLEVYEHF